jgi:hypothetical protein
MTREELLDSLKDVPWRVAARTYELPRDADRAHGAVVAQPERR